MDTHALLGVTNLKLKYPGDAPLVFDGLTLSFRKGEKALLLGPSGCGKSTLMQVLTGIVPRSVELPMKCDAVVRPARWGYVFQDPDAQFCMPYVDEELAFVLENRAVPREAMPELIRLHLALVGLRLDDPHTPIQRLSQGMKQRLALASALALEPEALLLDEPTALLDPEGTEQVWEAVRRTAADKTVLIVEHKIDGILDWIDRVVVFTPEGRILADGPPADVFASHREALDEYGIWHPGAWEAFPRIAGAHDPAIVEGAPRLAMREFAGYRAGGREVIAAPRAEAAPGDWIAVTGKNGAGKSSLLLSIMRLLRTSGECVADGAFGLRPEDVAARAAFVFQNPEFQFVADSVEDEIAYSLERPDPAAVESLLAFFDLAPLRRRHPYQLSTGQKRRLSVAGALARGQRLLLLDEPTFGLDARSTMRLLEMLERLRSEGATIIMVTHDPEIVRRCCNKIWHVEDGRLTVLETEKEGIEHGMVVPAS